MFPLDIVSLFGKVFGYGVFLLIGMAFGAVLEVAGFGDSRKLSAQFYFRDMTVLKVMFTAIVVAMVLIFAGNALGLVDFPKIYVNPTCLWPQIIGGLILGFGFIIGGFCPGTSIVAMSTLKVDGIFFFGGVFAGVWLFGETVGSFNNFYESGFMGRFTLPDLLKADAGVVVLAVVLMAVMAFAAAGWAEKKFGRPLTASIESGRRRRLNRRIAALSLISAAALVLVIGQPSAEKRWRWMSQREEQRIDQREVFVHPAEMVELMHNPQIYLHILDVRQESDYNLFHLREAIHVPFQQIKSTFFQEMLGQAHPNTVNVVVANGEQTAVAAYRLLLGHGLLNVYILEGGINSWLKTFPPDPAVAVATGQTETESLAFRFTQSLGDRLEIALPLPETILERFGTQFPHHVKLQVKKVLKGGCG